jgi:hypothetical protein
VRVGERLDTAKLRCELLARPERLLDTLEQIDALLAHDRRTRRGLATLTDIERVVRAALPYSETRRQR